MNFRKSLFLFASIFALTFVTAQTTVLNSAKVLDWYPTVTVENDAFKNFKTGDTITLSYEKTDASYHQIKLYSGEWFALINGKLSGAENQNGSFVPNNNSGTIVYSTTATEASSIKKSGLRFHGFGLKITKITIGSGAEKSTETKSTETKSTETKSTETKIVAAEKIIYSGSVDLDWGSNISIPAEKFSSFDKNSKLQFAFSNNSGSYHNIKIYSGQWSPLGAGKVQGAANNSSTFVPSSNGGTILYTPTSTELNLLKSSGLITHGFGVTLKSISIVSSSTEATSIATESKSDESNTKTEATNTTTSNPKPATITGTPFANHGALHVEGSALKDKNNKIYQLYGMSTHGLNFGNDFSKYVNKESFKTLRDDWNTNCIRLVLYPKDYNGYCNGGNQAQLKKLICDGIDYATDLGMYVIVDWHVHNYNPRETENQASDFLNQISSKYAKYENVIYEICNEPTNAPWDSQIKPYAEKIIPIIRKNAPNAIVIVGTNTWSQDIEGPLANPLSYKNIMYSFHFYAQTHTDSFRNRVENAIKRGLPIFITEFGTCDASGNGGFNSAQSEKWFELLSKYNISHMNWSLSNKNETASAISSGCSKTSGWTSNDLTQSGKLIYNHFRKLSR